MWKTVSGGIAVLLLLVGGNAQAATVDLTDNVFSSITHETFAQGPIGPPIAFEETVSGVTFSFARTSGQFRLVGTHGNGTTNLNGPFAADMGGGAASVRGFTLSVSQDVTLNAFIGLAQRFNTNPIFNVTGGSVSSIGNTFSVNGFLGTIAPASVAFAGGPLQLEAGTSYLFDVTNAGVVTRGFLTGLNFTAVQAVPLPASFPLLMVGLAVFGFVARRRGKAT